MLDCILYGRSVGFNAAKLPTLPRRPASCWKAKLERWLLNTPGKVDNVCQITHDAVTLQQKTTMSTYIVQAHMELIQINAHENDKSEKLNKNT